MSGEKKFWNEDLSRRAFLKWSGVVGGATLAGSTLVGYAPAAHADTTTGDATTGLPFGADTVVPVRCGCGDVCGTYHMGNVYVKDGVIVYYDGCKEAENKGGLCARGMSAMQVIYHPDRVKYPMKRINEKGVAGRFQRISWDEAYDLMAQKMVDAINDEGSQTVGFDSGHSMTRTTGVQGRLTGMFSFDSAGSAHGCWANLAFGPWITLGDYYHFHVEDFHHSKLIVLWGHNKAISMPSEWSHGIMEAKEKYGAKLVVIDPRFTETAEKADLYLPVRPGTDAALALGMANVIINENLYDKEFVAKYTVGFEEYKELAMEFTPERVEEITWCPADRIRQAARWYATIKPAVLEFGRGGNYVSGDAGWLCSRGATCLMGLTGQVGVRGAGYSVETSVYSPSGTGFSKWVPFGSWNWTGDPLVKRTAPPVSSLWGQTDVLYDRKPYGYRVLYLRTDLVGKLADTNRLEKAMMQVPFVISEQRFINYTASHFADLVLPNALWTEQTMLYAEYTHLIATGPAMQPMFESKPTWLIAVELADKICEKLGLDLTKEEICPWRTDEEIINQAFNNPDMPLGGYPALNYQDAIKNPQGYRLTRYHNQEGFIPYHVDNDPEKDLYFPTPSGKIEFVAERMKDLNLPTLPIHTEPTESPVSTPEIFEDYPLISHGRAHRHWTFLGYNLIEDGGMASPLIREAFETAKEPTIELNPKMASELGLKAGDMVWAESPWGKVQGRLRLSERIHPQMAVTPYGWGGHQNKINPVRLSLYSGLKLPMVNVYGEGKMSGDLGGQATFAGIPVKVYKA